MSQLTIKLSANADTMIGQLQKEIFNRWRKKITAVGTNNMITTDIDSSSASADYTHPDNSTPQAIVQRCVCIEAGTANLVVEEVQVVGG